MTERPRTRTIWAILMVAWVAACSPLTGSMIVASDRGIGGTGISGDDRGIGGTGIVGTITAFGSIFVNGFEVEFAPDVPVQANGEPRSADDLKVGQVVSLIADVRNGELTTEAIEVQPAVVGQVERSDPGGIVVAGQTVDLTASGYLTGGETFAVGDWVEVNGLRGADGVIQASLVEARDDVGVVTVRGTVESTGRGLAVGQLALSGAAGIRSGDSVVVSGAQRGGVLDVAAVTVEPDVPFGGAVAVVSIEGIVDRDPAGQDLRVGGVAVRGADRETALEPGARVSVVGRPAAGGIVVNDAARSGPDAPNRSIDTLEEGRGAPGGGPSRGGPDNRDSGPSVDRGGEGSADNADSDGRGGSPAVEVDTAPPSTGVAPAPGGNAPPDNDSPPGPPSVAPSDSDTGETPPAAGDHSPPESDDGAPPDSGGSNAPSGNSR